ncbi:TetR/AcrR family transcriptional regulator [Paenibacillus sp. SYP-B3998]|uniref:TetR/AcrR family transcriptional regulator n=1 Tax=Paenibacillus sp. SYP-B3998 TaxID=2678564 RepID=A0A6G3ZZP7_9BACL|nr:TetR/AcrR family transcriptional regulator [Paenibacillus sp. SYP-B3998]NEW07585.1 TetR/AcrR family transcriptional regulator [Paenibacillus sp. SYP-B3998]
MSATRIREAAIELFANQGYEKTTLSDIARRVGIKTPSIYAHYASKEDLFLAVTEEVINNNVYIMRDQYGKETDADPEKQIMHYFHRVTNTFRHDHYHLFYKRFIFFPPDALKEKLLQPFLQGEKEMTESLIRLYKAGVDAGQFRSMETDCFIAAFYCAVDGLFMQYQLYEAEEYDQRKARVWDFFSAGLRSNKE